MPESPNDGTGEDATLLAMARRIFDAYVHRGHSIERIADDERLDRQTIVTILHIESDQRSGERAQLIETERAKSLACYTEVRDHCLKLGTPAAMRNAARAQRGIDSLLGLRAPTRVSMGAAPRAESKPEPELDAQAGIASLERLIAEDDDDDGDE